MECKKLISLPISATLSLVGVLLFLTLPIATPALAVDNDDLRFETTDDLIAVCSAPNSSAAQLGCTGFIEATVQYHDAVSDRKNLKRLACFPNGTSIEDGRVAFLSWAKTNKANKELMSELPVIGLVRSLAAAYPCP
ncbi:hypothetical protein Thiowin_02162 [Thiorhodovibrio winogradskyi]|uniref:Rap1a immunity protein domain-containing protein n=1 Tax=Thiorhodovibrio winogradskyi TaxID=77007 RepID=A0ABZ0S842_9GAMM|nr:Rap1a/Tai family immunity protein [Thiorhodovibrio winogradskyi]